jgi:adenosylhomocysteine nucleosidase
MRRRTLLACIVSLAAALAAALFAFERWGSTWGTGREAADELALPLTRPKGESAVNPPTRRVAVIAAMPSELAPFVAKFGAMTKESLGDRPLYRGSLGDVEVLATRTGMGTDFATEVTDRVLDRYEVDHVIAIGIAGGVEGVAVGDVLTPSHVINGDDGSEFVTAPPPGVTPRGKLRTSKHFSAEKGLMARLAGEGINAVDMETAAIVASAVRHQCSWSVYRAISDRASDDLVDSEIFGMAKPDGSPDYWASLRFIARRPWMLPRLVRIGRDAQRAADAAAEAAMRELRGA